MGALITFLLGVFAACSGNDDQSLGTPKPVDRTFVAHHLDRPTVWITSAYIPSTFMLAVLDASVTRGRGRTT